MQRVNVLFIMMVVGLLSLTPTWTARADSDVQKCAEACGQVRNVCRTGATPDVKGSCSQLDACKEMQDQDWAVANTWFTACVSNIHVTCPAACMPPKVTTTPAGTGSTGASVPASVPASVSSGFKQKCEAAHGVYVVERVTKAHPDRVDTHEECYKLLDARDAIAALEKRVAELEKGRQPGQPVTIPPDLTALYERVRQLTEVANAHTIAIQGLQGDVARTLQRYDALNQRVDKLEQNVSQLDGKVVGLQTQVNGLRDRPTALPPAANAPPASAPPAQVVVHKNGLPCSLALYGRLHMHKVWDYTMGSEGLELGCSLFSSTDGSRSFHVAVGVGYANTYYDHKLYELHVDLGPKFMVGQRTELLVPFTMERINSSNWERGVLTSLGVLPELRYRPTEGTLFVGGKIGPVVVHSAPPLPPDQMTEDEPTTHLSGIVGLVVGGDF